MQRADVVRRHYRAGDTKHRLRVAFAVAAVLFVLVIGRVALLQTVQADSLRAAGLDQRTTETVLKATRGTIFARDGGELAISVPATTVTANPKAVIDAVGTARVLAQMLDLTPERQQSLADSFIAKDKSFVYVARLVDDDIAQSVLDLGLPGVASIRESKRILPSGDVGRSVVGRTDPDGLGTAGLEMQFNDLLTGVDGERVREHDRDGRSIPGAGATTTDPIPGDDMVLTLDRSMQFQVEQVLLKRVDELIAKGGTAVVMDTSSGEIYSIANVRRGDDGVARVTSANLAAVEAYEPGSVAKVFSIAAALDVGVATPDTVLDVPGAMVFDKDTRYEFTITDAYPHATEPMSVRDILVHSSNIGTLLTAERVGVVRLGSYLDQFGFGHKTALDFPGESAGIMKPAEKWEGTERVSASFGYGFSATSLQLIAGVNAVANGGLYVAPKLVKGTIGADGKLLDSAPSATHRVLSEPTAATMIDLLTDVVCRGTATRAQLADISTAGKTGTGYKVQQNGTYQGDEGQRAYFATFVGFLPADNPQVTILVSIDEPDPTTQDRFGGTAAAPVFADIARTAIHELHITPTAGDTGCTNTGG